MHTHTHVHVHVHVHVHICACRMRMHMHSLSHAQAVHVGNTPTRVVVNEDDPSPLAEALASEGDSYPKLLASRAAYSADGFAPEAYEGDLKDRAAVVAWLETFALKERKASSAPKTGTEDEGATDAAAWPAGYEVSTAASESDFDAMVLKAEAAVLD